MQRLGCSIEDTRGVQALWFRVWVWRACGCVLYGYKVQPDVHKLLLSHNYGVSTWGQGGDAPRDNCLLGGAGPYGWYSPKGNLSEWTSRNVD